MSGFKLTEAFIRALDCGVLESIREQLGRSDGDIVRIAVGERSS